MLNLPQKMEFLRSQIEVTQRQYIKIIGELEETTRLASKFGGEPYWPLNKAYPTLQDGTALAFLAQINLTELPIHLPNYPTKGMLQFYILADELYGLFSEKEQQEKQYQVVYHEQIFEDEAMWGAVPNYPKDELPYVDAVAMRFVVEEEFLGTEDFRFEKLPFNLYELYDEAVADEVTDEYGEMVTNEGHKLGGYPYFTQWDPRENDEQYVDYELLFQMDTDYELKMMWGDAGVGNFFIDPADLKRLDFSNVLFYWDCH